MFTGNAAASLAQNVTLAYRAVAVGVFAGGLEAPSARAASGSGQKFVVYVGSIGRSWQGAVTTQLHCKFRRSRNAARGVQAA